MAVWVVFIGPYPVGVDVHQIEIAIKAHPGGLVRDPGLRSSALRAVRTDDEACKKVEGQRAGSTSDGYRTSYSACSSCVAADDDLLAVDLERASLQDELTHVEADLLDDRVAGLHVGTAGSLVLDLVGPILIPLGPAVDRRIELQAEGLDAVAGVEAEQAVVVR